MEKVIEITNLTKLYDLEKGIKNINLEVKKGEIFGFIGPNGAGKSTLIRTILGLLKPSNGNIKFFEENFKTNREKSLQKIGYLPSEVKYYQKMTAEQILDFAGSFYDQKDFKTEQLRLAKILKLNLKDQFEQMSLGNKKKVGIIQALQHQPKLVILDEPTSGLDPLIQRNFFNELLKIKKEGKTIFFSSHVLSEVQKICDKVAIIKEGRIIKVATIKELENNRSQKISIEFKTKVDQEKFVNQFKNVVIKDEKAILNFQGDINQLISELANYAIKNLIIAESEIEEIFINYYEQPAKENNDN